VWRLIYLKKYFNINGLGYIVDSIDQLMIYPSVMNTLMRSWMLLLLVTFTLSAPSFAASRECKRQRAFALNLKLVTMVFHQIAHTPEYLTTSCPWITRHELPYLRQQAEIIASSTEDDQPENSTRMSQLVSLLEYMCDPSVLPGDLRLMVDLLPHAEDMADGPETQAFLAYMDKESDCKRIK
jgi:hypothetical protein